jgi:hypothetical protein
MIECGLQRGGIIGHKVADGAEAAVFCADRLVVGKQEHRNSHHQAAVVSAVQVVLPSVLM